jgi:hypothetical protein
LETKLLGSNEFLSDDSNCGIGSPDDDDDDDDVEYEIA